MDSAYVVELATGNNGVKYLLVHPHLFHRTVDAIKGKAKRSKGMVCAFSTTITQKIGSKREKNMLESLKNYA